MATRTLVWEITFETEDDLGRPTLSDDASEIADDMFEWVIEAHNAGKFPPQYTEWRADWKDEI